MSLEIPQTIDSANKIRVIVLQVGNQSPQSFFEFSNLIKSTNVVELTNKPTAAGLICI